MRILVIGAGSIGRRHLTNLKSVPEVSGRLAFDTDRTRLAEVFQADAGVQCFQTIEKAYAESPEVVLVCTPTSLHVEHAVQALRRGAHVFIEKPIADSLRGAAEIEVEARKSGARVMVACNMRFHPAVALLKAELESGRPGRLHSIRASFGHYLPNWRRGQDYRQTYSANRDQGGGVILDCIHEIDYVRWLAGDAQGVFGLADRVGDLSIDVEDTAVVLMRHVSGVLSEIHMDYLRRDKHRSCELVCSEGTLVWESAEKLPEKVKVTRFLAKEGRQETLLDLSNYDPNEAYRLELGHFFECIRLGRAPALDAAGGMRVLELALQARASAERQKATL